MKRGPSIAKILDTRNLKAIRLRFDVRAEQSWEPPQPKARIETPRVKRYDDDLPMTSDWME